LGIGFKIQYWESEKMSWFSSNWKNFDVWIDAPNLAEETEWNFKYLKATTKGLTTDDLRSSVDKLHKETKRIKSEGVSVWNAKSVIPKIFDVVDGSFVTMKELVDKIGELETRLDVIDKSKLEEKLDNTKTILE
jgi:hypothetical protein